MSLYYSSDKQAEKWYNTPNMYFSSNWIDKATPKEMVDLDQGQEVLDWINICIKDK